MGLLGRSEGGGEGCRKKDPARGGEGDSGGGKTQNVPYWVFVDNFVSSSHGENFSGHSSVPVEKHKAMWGPSLIGGTNKWPPTEDSVTEQKMGGGFLLLPLDTQQVLGEVYC